jgi:hypothetical protein
MGKTETIKKRKVEVYLVTEGQKERWQKYAKDKNTSLSKFIIETVEARVKGNLMKQLKVKETLTNENNDLREENRVLKIQNKRHERYIEILERDMKRAQHISFGETGDGYRMFNKDLTGLLKDSNKPVPNHSILSLLGVDPTDTEAVKGIRNQLEALKGYGLIKDTKRGWKWVG